MRDLVVGVIGRAGHGKDSCAAVLQDEFGFSSLALAYNLKRDIQENFSSFPEASMEAQSSRDRAPWVRRLQQIYGTEWCRERLGKDYWLDRWSEKAKKWFNYGARAIVVPDVRFPNEVSYLRSRWDAEFIFVERPGHEEPGVDPNHGSEKHIPELREAATLEVINSEDLAALRTILVERVEIFWQVGNI